MSNFYQEKLSELGLSEFRILERIQIDDISFGMVSLDHDVSQMFRAFYESNDDNRNLMANMAMKEHQV